MIPRIPMVTHKTFSTKVVAEKAKSMVLIVFKFFSTFVFACVDNIMSSNVLLLLKESNY